MKHPKGFRCVALTLTLKHLGLRFSGGLYLEDNSWITMAIHWF